MARKPAADPMDDAMEPTHSPLKALWRKREGRFPAPSVVGSLSMVSSPPDCGASEREAGRRGQMNLADRGVGPAGNAKVWTACSAHRSRPSPPWASGPRCRCRAPGLLELSRRGRNERTCHRVMTSRSAYPVRFCLWRLPASGAPPGRSGAGQITRCRCTTLRSSLHHPRTCRQPHRHRRR